MLAAVESMGHLADAGRYVLALLDDVRQAMEPGGPDPADPEHLGRISAPLLVLHGSATMRFFTAAAQHVADHVAGARLQEIVGAGHAAPLTHPEALATAVTSFFSPAARPA